MSAPLAGRQALFEAGGHRFDEGASIGLRRSISAVRPLIPSSIVTILSDFFRGRFWQLK